MPNAQLSYGLNLPKKPSLNSRGAAASKQKTIFDDSDSGAEEEDPSNFNRAESISTFSTPTSKPSQFKTSAENIFKSRLAARNGSAPKPPHQNGGNPTTVSGNLSAQHSAAKQAQEAQTLDSSVYDYDSVYDSLHAQKSAKKTSDRPAGPKYMANLLAAAEVRKRDQLRAKEKMLTKEREAEGEAFADKEKFVTEAYKAQQAEVQRLEEEEKRKEEKERERKRGMGGGMTGLYKGLLEREEQRHEAAVKAVEEGIGGRGENEGRDVDVEEKDEKAEKSEAELAKEKGAVVNEDGQVVDKRQLLQAGLNVKAKPKTQGPQAAGKAKLAPSETMSILQGRGNSKAAMRERQSRMLEEQLEQAAKRAADDQEVEQEALQRAAKSKKTEGEIISAKERYLQRKREAEAAKAAGKEPS